MINLLYVFSPSLLIECTILQKVDSNFFLGLAYNKIIVTTLHYQLIMSSNLDDSNTMLTSYYDEKWPEKMVILITSHGSFSRHGAEADSEIRTMKVPSGINVNYLYSSSHGGVTAYMENGAKRMFDFTKTHIPQLLSDNPDDTKSALSQYSKIMMNVKDEVIDSVINDIKNYKQFTKSLFYKLI